MTTRIIVTTLFAATLAACASAPDRNTALDQAQTHYNTAQRNSQVTTLAQSELNEAREALRLAQEAWENKQDPARVNHLAYLANQRTRIAEDTAASLAAQAITANASAERDKLRLTMRSREADQAALRATQSEQRSLRAAEALTAARTEATEDARQRETRIRELESALEDLNAKQTDRGMVVTLGDVLFNTGQAEILPSASANINKLANFLKQYPQQQASIEGYTDSTGTPAGNYALSQRRADAVRSALMQLGVKREQLTTQAYGQDNPIADNSTAVGRQLNRRVEIVFESETDDVSIRE